MFPRERKTDDDRETISCLLRKIRRKNGLTQREKKNVDISHRKREREIHVLIVVPLRGNGFDIGHYRNCAINRGKVLIFLFSSFEINIQRITILLLFIKNISFIDCEKEKKFI